MGYYVNPPMSRKRIAQIERKQTRNGWRFGKYVVGSSAGRYVVIADDQSVKPAFFSDVEEARAHARTLAAEGK